MSERDEQTNPDEAEAPEAAAEPSPAPELNAGGDPGESSAPDESSAPVEDGEPAEAGEPIEAGQAGDTGEPVSETVEERPGMDLRQLMAVVEALVFASPEPLTPKMLFKLLADEPREDVMAAAEALKTEYAERPGLQLAEVAGGYQITTRPELHEWVRRLFHERTTQKLSVASLETLSVIAYKQPITQAEIGEIRGVNASGVLSTLLERHLIKIVGRKNVIGRPFLYGTTREFLIRFGLNDLNDLPKIEDMAQQLGFEPPAVLMERSVPDEMLPLEEEGNPEGLPPQDP